MVNRTGQAVWPAPSRGRLLLQLAGLPALAALTIALAVAADGNPAAVVAPLLAVTLIWIVTVAPIRKTLLALVFVCLALDKPGDAENLWQSPLAPIGGLLMENLNKTINIDALKFNLLTVLLVFLLAIRIRRVLSRRSNPESGITPPAWPLTWALVASFATVVWLCVYGIAMGGDPQMCKIQVQTFVLMLLMAYLTGACLRGTRDYHALGTIVVATALLKAGVAVYVRHILPPYVGWPPREVEYTTTHGDSLLFAAAFAIVTASYFERADRRSFWTFFLTVPVLIAGMVANNRRLVWLQVLAGLIVMLVINPRSRVTRTVVRVLTYAAPVLLLYGAVGWNSSSRVFAPVQMIHSVGDANVNRSTLYRDGENFNLLYTFRRNPVLGSGFGHPFDQVAILDDISNAFREWRYLPHNSILGLWAFAGATGFSGLWLAIVVGSLLAVRAYASANSAADRTAALTAISVIMAYTIHCWGDIGFSEQKSIFLVGAALGISGQLAAATGGWPAIRAVGSLRLRM